MNVLRALFGGSLPAFLVLFLESGAAWAEAPPPGTISGSADPAAAPLLTAAPAAPPAYDLPPPSARWNLLGTGLAVTGVSYGLALGAGFAWPDARYSNELKIPIVGPWMAIADTGCPKDEPECSTVLLVFTAVVTGMDGVLQAGGLGLALESIFLPTASPKPRPRRAATVRPVPIVAGRDGMGLGVAGTF